MIAEFIVTGVKARYEVRSFANNTQIHKQSDFKRAFLIVGTEAKTTE